MTTWSGPARPRGRSLDGGRHFGVDIEADAIGLGRPSRSRRIRLRLDRERRAASCVLAGERRDQPTGRCRRAPPSHHDGRFRRLRARVPVYAAALRASVPGHAWKAALATGAATLAVAATPLDVSPTLDLVHGGF